MKDILKEMGFKDIVEREDGRFDATKDYQRYIGLYIAQSIGGLSQNPNEFVVTAALRYEEKQMCNLCKDDERISEYVKNRKYTDLYLDCKPSPDLAKHFDKYIAELNKTQGRDLKPFSLLNCFVADRSERDAEGNSRYTLHIASLTEGMEKKWDQKKIIEFLCKYRK